MMELERAVMDYASRNRETLLTNFYLMGRRSIEKGSKDSWTVTPKRIDAMKAMAEKMRKEDPTAYYASVRGSMGRGGGGGRGGPTASTDATAAPATGAAGVIAPGAGAAGIVAAGADATVTTPVAGTSGATGAGGGGAGENTAADAAFTAFGLPGAPTEGGGAGGDSVVGRAFAPPIPMDVYTKTLRDPEFRDRAAISSRAQQDDFPTAVKFINVLLKGGVEVHRATAQFHGRRKDLSGGFVCREVGAGVSSRGARLVRAAGSPDGFRLSRRPAKAPV